MEWRGGSSLAFTKIAATPYMFDTLAVLKHNTNVREQAQHSSHIKHTALKPVQTIYIITSRIAPPAERKCMIATLLPQRLKKFRGLYGLFTTSYYTCARSWKERKAGEWGYLHKANILRVDTETLPACVKPIFANHAMTVPAHPAAMPRHMHILPLNPQNQQYSISDQIAIT